MKNMKFLSSSSSSASSTITATTSTSYEGGACTSKNASAGCIAGMLRRLLCSTGLPTHPSDHLKEAESESLFSGKTEENLESSAAPNIVARLMGLEAMPQSYLANGRGSPDSISRSRSLNSVDSLRELRSVQGRHRRVKSFREIPTYFELEDENFFILSFENERERGEVGLKQRKSETGLGESKQKNTEKSRGNNERRKSVHMKNKENEDPAKVSDEKLHSRQSSPNAGIDGKLKDPKNVLRPKNNSHRNSQCGIEVVNSSSDVHQKQFLEAGSARTKKKKRKDDCLAVKKDEAESDSENSSPNSVLDFVEFSVDPETCSSEKLSRLTCSKSRRTLSEELENYRKLNQCNTKNSLRDDCGSKGSGDKCIELGKKDYKGQDCVRMWAEVCRLADRQTTQENWICKRITEVEDHKEIIRDFGSEILDQLLGELVDQLVGG